MLSRDFRWFWAGQSVSQLGEQASLVVIPLLAVFVQHVGPEELGLLRAVGQAPFLLLALPAGVWVDRWRTRSVMVFADLARALVLFGAALESTSLFVVAFLVGALSVLFDVAYQASLPRLVRPDQLVQGNSAVEGSRSVAQIAGPALGAALVEAGASVAVVSCALVFVVSLLAIAQIREPAPARVREKQRLREGLRFVVGDPFLRTIAAASAAFQFALAATMTAYLLFLPRELHLSAAQIGLVLAATAPGALVGSLLAARLPQRFGYGPVVVVAALIGDGVLLLVPATSGGIVALIAINLVFGAFGQLTNVTLMTVRQAVTPVRLQGRVTATITFAGMGMMPLGSLVGGLLAAHLELRTSLLVTGVAMLLSPVLILMSPLARLGVRAGAA